MKVVLVIFRTLLYIVYFLIIAAGIAIAVLLLQGKRLYCIETGSMEPTCPVGAMIVVEKTEFEQLNENDIITFVISDNTIVTHRLVGIDSENRLLTTKGDANMFADNSPVSYENVIGRVSFCVPLAGYLFIILSTRFGRIMLCITVIAIVGIHLIRRYAKSPAEDDPPSEDGNDAEGVSTSEADDPCKDDNSSAAESDADTDKPQTTDIIEDHDSGSEDEGSGFQ